MTKKEYEWKMEDSMIQVMKYLFFDGVLAYVLLTFSSIEVMVVATPLLLLTVISTFDWIDRIFFLREKKKEIEA